MTTSGKECLIEFENMMRLLARIAILNEPWLQNAEEVLTAMMEVYNEIVAMMPHMHYLESNNDFVKYYRLRNSKGNVMNSHFFSRRYMLFLDRPIANICEEFLNPKVSGLSIFTQFSGSENYRDMGMAAKTVLSNQFSNAHVTFNYDQMFQQGNRRLTSYGKNNLNHSK